jgi:hypothetical protein
MFKHRARFFVGTLALIVVLLSAYSAVRAHEVEMPTKSSSALATPTQTPTVTPTETPTLTPTPIPTETPTSTPTPTPTPTLTPRPPAIPTVRFVSPATGTSVVAGQTVTIQSVAIAEAGVARIELWADGTLYVSTPNPQPGWWIMYGTQTWTSTAQGSHTLVLRSYDTRGQVSPDAAITVNIVGTPTQPTVEFTQPNPPSGRIVVQSDDSVPIEYTASDPNGIVRMELWSDDQIYAVDTNSSPITVMNAAHTWSSSALGDHTLFVRAYNAQNQYSDSPQLIIGVADRNPPAVSIVSPANGTQIATGSTVPVAISAGDSKGIMHLELWVDGLLYVSWNSTSPVGESTVQVSLAWQQPTPGNHTLYVVASDSQGLSTTTPQITVDIVAPPQPAPTRLPGPPLTVNPVASPTSLLFQTITGQTAPDVNVFITSAAGGFFARSDPSGAFAITINLTPQTINRLVVRAVYRNRNAVATTTRTDINGNPLDIQQISAPIATPAPPTPTSTPVPPTATPVPPTPTPVPPTATPIPPTRTPVPPTPTPVPPTPTPVTPTPTRIPRRTPQPRLTPPPRIR